MIEVTIVFKPDHKIQCEFKYFSFKFYYFLLSEGKYPKIL